MNLPIFKRLITWKIRLFLYLSSLSSLIFMQNYCTNICPFIDGLRPLQIVTNLFIVFIFHIIIREVLFIKFNNYKGKLSTPRLGYYLSITSWMLAGVVALAIHYFKYDNFPMASHIKLLSSYWILGAGILAQLEYIIYEVRYKSIVSNNDFNNYREKNI